MFDPVIPAKTQRSTAGAWGRRRLLASIATGALIAMPAVVHAQDASTPATRPDPVANLPATGGEIVVTAQRRSESLKAVPISITAVSPQQLQQFNLKTIDSIQTITPGLTFNTALTFAQNYIRGVGTAYAQPGLESAVATYVDGAYSPRSLGSIFDLLDVQSVQVLKGPQGTLYGRNATGGAILINSADPTDHPELHLAAEYGRFNHALIEGVANLPVTDTLAVRFAARESHEDGYIDNIYDGSHFGGRISYQVRGKARWAPSSDFSAVLGVQYNHSRDRSGASAQRIGAPVCLACGVPGAGVAPVEGFYQANADLNEPFYATTKLVNLHMQYRTGILHFDSVTAYRDQQFHAVVDEDFSPLPLFDYHTVSGGKTFTQDVTVSTQASGWINGLVGVSYEHDNAIQNAMISGSSFAAVLDATGVYPATDNDYRTRSVSGFGEIYLTPIDHLKVTLGGRYTHDKRSMAGVDNAGALLALVPPDSPATFGRRATFHSFTPRAVVAYDTGPVNLYASFNKGFKAGGYSSPTFVTPTVVKPEKITSYEIGAKYQSADHKLQINAAAFYYIYKDLQVSITDLASGGQATTNAASARGRGFELDGQYRPVKWLNLAAGGSYLRARYRDFPSASVQIATATGLVAGAEDLGGTQLVRAPKFTAYASATINVPVGDAWTAKLSGVARYSSAYLFYPGAGGNLGYDKQPRYTVANLTGSIGPSRDTYRIGFYVNNVFDKHYYVTRQTTAPFGAFDIVAPPRTYGVRLDFNF